MSRLQEIRQAIRKVAEDPERVLAYRGAMWSALEAIDVLTEGYVLVPEDISPEMINAVTDERIRSIETGEHHDAASTKLKREYKAMLQAYKDDK